MVLMQTKVCVYIHGFMVANMNLGGEKKATAYRF